MAQILAYNIYRIHAEAATSAILLDCKSLGIFDELVAHDNFVVVKDLLF